MRDSEMNRESRLNTNTNTSARKAEAGRSLYQGLETGEPFIDQELDNAQAGIEPDSADPRPTTALVVDADASRRNKIARCLDDAIIDKDGAQGLGGVELCMAENVEQARQVIAEQAVDLAVVAQELPDAEGLTLIGEVRQGSDPVQTVLLCHEPSIELAVEAMRCEVGDLIVGDVDDQTLTERLGQAWTRHEAHTAPYHRARRLSRLCRQLNDARLDVSRQVDSLCEDLVSAYEELAGQMEHAVQSSEYSGQIRDVLDLEDLVRITLDHLLQRTGPTNAAVFLPMTMDEYSVAGYVNLDMAEESSSWVLDHLADVLAAKLTSHDGLVHLTDEQSQCQWLGDDALFLAGQELIAFAAHANDETLAVVALFREDDQPFDPTVIETCQAVAPVFGQALCRVVQVHHRHLE